MQRTGRPFGLKCMNESRNSKSVYVIHGVSGCGKTTIGQELANELQIPFKDADDYHPKSNIDKMQAGIPLGDNDRLPWLKKLSDKIKVWNSSRGAVLACSALKESYRSILSENNNEIVWVHLSGSFDVISNRLKKRMNHFFNKNLLQDQFDNLEVPNYGLHINIEADVQTVVKKILTPTKII